MKIILTIKPYYFRGTLCMWEHAAYFASSRSTPCIPDDCQQSRSHDCKFAALSLGYIVIRNRTFRFRDVYGLELPQYRILRLRHAKLFLTTSLRKEGWIWQHDGLADNVVEADDAQTCSRRRASVFCHGRQPSLTQQRLNYYWRA